MTCSGKNTLWNLPESELSKHASLVILYYMLSTGTRERALFVFILERQRKCKQRSGAEEDRVS